MCGLPKFSVDTYEYLSGNKLENSEKLIENFVLQRNLDFHNWRTDFEKLQKTIATKSLKRIKENFKNLCANGQNP